MGLFVNDDFLVKLIKSVSTSNLRIKVYFVFLRILRNNED